MITLHGLPIRRLEYLWRNDRGESIYLTETKGGRTQCVPLSAIGTDEGSQEVLRIAQLNRGTVLEDYGDSR